VFLVLILVLAGCGRKGNPMPPLRPMPARLADLAARRVDDRIELRFTIPAANADGTTPAAADRFDIFLLSTTAGAPVPRVADVDQIKNARHSIHVHPTTQPPGSVAVYTDTVMATQTGASAAVLNYLVVGVAGRQRQLSAVVSVPLATLTAPPEELTFTYDQQQLKLTWKAGGAGQRFRVYEVDATGRPKDAAAPPSPPQEALEFAAPVEFDKERCLAVRGTQTTGVTTIESAPALKCVTPVDTFIPPAAANLRAFGGQASITLTWDAVAAPDLAGYIVLRGEGAGDTLQPQSELLTTTTFTDTKAVPGVTYWYAVLAMDKAKNPSEQSNRVQATAR
jgi:hypothetical protein